MVKITLFTYRGDPGRCDLLGRTALHWAAVNGHLQAAAFLLSFGGSSANSKNVCDLLWALDNERHSAVEAAALGGREEVVRFLDALSGQQEALVGVKAVQRAKERALAEAEKRIKRFEKLHNKNTKAAEKEAKAAERRRRKSLCDLTLTGNGNGFTSDCQNVHQHLIYNNNNHCDLNHNEPACNHIYELLPNCLEQTVDSKGGHHHHSTVSSSTSTTMKFSDLVNTNLKNSSSSSSTSRTMGGTIGSRMKMLSGVTKRVLIRNNSKTPQPNSATSTTDTLRSNCSNRSATNNSTLIRGIRRDDQITYVPRLYGSLSVTNLATAVDEEGDDNNQNQQCKLQHQYSPSTLQPNGRLHLKDVFHDGTSTDKGVMEGGGVMANKVGTFNKHNKTSIKSKLLSRLNYQKSKLKPNASTSSSSSGSSGGTLYRTHSEPDFTLLNTFDDDRNGSSNTHCQLNSETSSIFERPGFGSVTFRGKFTPESLFFTSSAKSRKKHVKKGGHRNRNYSSTADSAGNSDQEEEEEDNEEEVDSGHDHSHTDSSLNSRNGSGTSGSLTKKYFSTTNLATPEALADHSSFASDSIGSAGSLVLQQDCDHHLLLEDDLHGHHFEIDEDGEDGEGSSKGPRELANKNQNAHLCCASKSIPVLLFLYAQGLRQYYDVFEAEAIDIEALMLLTEEDFVSLGIPLGPRRKLLNAIRQRRKLLNETGSSSCSSEKTPPLPSTVAGKNVASLTGSGNKVFETKL